MTKKQKRMKAIVNRMKDYINTYENQPYYLDYSDTTFILDMVYGIGICIDPKKYKFRNGLNDFFKVLKNYLETD